MVWRSVIFCLAILAGVTAGSYFGATAIVQAQAPSTSGEAAAVLSAAREALGGEKRLSSVKTVIANGQTRQLQGENLVPILFEINIELPEKYVRTDEIPARESGPSSRGFNGDGLIQSGDGPAARRGAPVEEALRRRGPHVATPLRTGAGVRPDRLPTRPHRSNRISRG